MDPSYLTELVERTIALDSSAEKELFDFFAGRIEYFVRRKIGADNPDWQDIQQDIFISFFRRIRDQQYDPQKGSLAAFLQCTIQYKVMDYYKTLPLKLKHETIEHYQYALIASDPSPDAAAENDQYRSIIKSAIATLPLKYKKIIYLAVYKQMRIHEIAQLLDIPEQAVSNYKSYAITLLQKKLKKFIDFDESL